MRGRADAGRARLFVIVGLGVEPLVVARPRHAAARRHHIGWLVDGVDQVERV